MRVSQICTWVNVDRGCTALSISKDTEPFSACHDNGVPSLGCSAGSHTHININTNRCTQPLPEWASAAGSESWFGTGPNDARHASALDNGRVTPANFYQGVNVSISKRLVPCERWDQSRDCRRSGCCSELDNRWLQWACSARRSLFLLLYIIFSDNGGGSEEQV